MVQGQASIVTQGQQMTISNSANAVLNWQSFSIGAGSSVRFEQPSASSQVLNRVLGRDATQIAGRLSSNGGKASPRVAGLGRGGSKGEGGGARRQVEVQRHARSGPSESGARTNGRRPNHSGSKKRGIAKS